MAPPILQFGTSRFLQAHVDLFVSQALERGEAGRALGGITVVQSSDDPARVARVAALAAGEGYSVRIRGLRRGVQVDDVVTCRAVRQAWRAQDAWLALREAIAGDVRVIVSNTADAGFRLDDRDTAALIADRESVPRSFPAKLLVLLHHRWRERPAAALSIYPCELVERNGDVLRNLVRTMAVQWSLESAFIAWLGARCVWANSLVDRIVSQALHPVGAVAEPYALWAIERQPGLVLPCDHEDIVPTHDLERHTRLKLFLLNAGHTYLAELWLSCRRPPDELVRQAMHDDFMRGELEALWADDILPMFDGLGQRAEAEAYLALLRERLMNPFLDHRLSDIAQNHAEKKRRRFAPIVALSRALGCRGRQTRLHATLSSPF